MITTTFYGYHRPTQENWLILGIDEKNNRICAAGWPPTMGKLTDIDNLKEADPLTEEEKQYRTANFGSNWD